MTQNLNHYEKILSRSHSNYLAQISIEMTDAREQPDQRGALEAHRAQYDTHPHEPHHRSVGDERARPRTGGGDSRLVRVDRGRARHHRHRGWILCVQTHGQMNKHAPASFIFGFSLRGGGSEDSALLFLFGNFAPCFLYFFPLLIDSTQALTTPQK